MNLPHHRRIQWHIMFRNYRRTIAICLIGFILFMLTTAWLAYAMSQAEVADYRLRLSSLEHDTSFRGTFGSWTPTDIEEGTTVIDLREAR